MLMSSFPPLYTKLKWITALMSIQMNNADTFHHAPDGVSLGCVLP